MNQKRIAGIGVALAVVLLVSSAVVWGLPTATPLTADDTYEEDLQFEEVSAETGFQYTADSRAQYGNGRTSVYVADYDRNGYPDILALGGGSGENSGPVLFENRGGEFERSGELTGVDAEKFPKGALFFDYDNDGWEDLLLLFPGQKPILFENENGNYVRQPDAFGDTQFTVPVTASAADFDRDGCLDLFVAQNGNWTTSFPQKEYLAPDDYDPDSARYDAEKPEGAYDDQNPANVVVDTDNGRSNFLFRGDCEGTFTDVTREMGIGDARWTTVVSFVDFTGDGYPDIHTGNDYNLDYLYTNQNGSGFEATRIPGTNRHAMASEVADFNHDGRMDIFEANIHFEYRIWTENILKTMNTTGGNALLVNTGDGFTTKESAYGVKDGGWGWAAAAVDFNNDGTRDLVHATKYYRNGTDRVDQTETKPRAWIGNGDGFTTVNASESGFEPTNARGIAHFDFDRDGDQDLVVSNIGGEFKLYENRDETGNWLQIDVRGDENRAALGARITVTSDSNSYTLVNNARADLQSQDTRVAHVGLESTDSVTVEVEWSDGTVQRFDGVDANQRIVVFPDGTSRTADPPSSE